jgi:hypothetical protein
VLAESNATALAPAAPRPPAGVVVREEGTREPLGPTVYRRAMAKAAPALVAEWRWSAMSPRCMLPGLITVCITLWAALVNARPVGMLAGLWGAVSALLAYYGLAIRLNRTELRVSDDALVLRHGPLPWPGRRVAFDELSRLFCRPEVRVRGDEHDAHELWASLRDGSQRPLARALTPDGARFLEQLVGARLDEVRAEGAGTG